MAAILEVMTYYPHHMTSPGHVADFKGKIFERAIEVSLS